MNVEQMYTNSFIIQSSAEVRTWKPAFKSLTVRALELYSEKNQTRLVKVFSVNMSQQVGIYSTSVHKNKQTKIQSLHRGDE